MKIRKLTLILYNHLIHIFHANYINYPNNILYSKRIKFRIPCYIYLSCIFIYLYSLPIWNNSSVFPWCFLVLGQSFQECLTVWVCFMFPPVCNQITHFWQEYHRSIKYDLLPAGSIQFQFVPLKVMILLITWLRCCLPGFPL